LIEAVPVKLVTTPLVGVPSNGVTNVGLVANTAEPVPVSLVSAVSNCREVNDPSEAALPTEVTMPVKLALVVTLEAVKAVAVPVMFVPTKAEGVPRAGVTRVGLFDKTTATVPVDDVTPVPPFATGNVPVTSVVSTTGLLETLTKSEPFQATKARVPEMTVTPVVGPAPRITMEPVPELMTK
jgi:hypothetical protein